MSNYWKNSQNKCAEKGVGSDGLLEMLELEPEAVEELAHGITVVDPRVPHLAREVVFSSRLPVEVKALTVTDNCITGTSAIHRSQLSLREEPRYDGLDGL